MYVFACVTSQYVIETTATRATCVYSENLSCSIKCITVENMWHIFVKWLHALYYNIDMPYTLWVESYIFGHILKQKCVLIPTINGNYFMI